MSIASINPYLMHGDGTVGNPYQIWTEYDFDEIRKFAIGPEFEHDGTLSHWVEPNSWLPDVYFKQMADIDLSHWEDSFIPIGWHYENNEWVMKWFKSVYDGNHFKIRNLKIDTTSKWYQEQDYDFSSYYFGLFSKVGRTGMLHNIFLENVKLKILFDNDNKYPGIPDKYVGGLIGLHVGIRYTDRRVHINNCHARGTIEVNSHIVGGLVGGTTPYLTPSTTQIAGPIIRNTSFIGELTGNHHIGGLYGKFIFSPNHTEIVDCFTIVKINTTIPTGSCGGICGVVYPPYLDFQNSPSSSFSSYSWSYCSINIIGHEEEKAGED